MTPMRPWQVASERAQSAVGYVYFSGGNITDVDTISIGGRTYEFSNDAAGAANVICNCGGILPAAPAVPLAAMVVAINADALRTVDAVNVGGASGLIALITRTPSATLPALAVTVLTVGGAIVVSAATMTGGLAETYCSFYPKNYTITAADVTSLALILGTSTIPIAAFSSTTTPRITGLLARRGNAILNLTDAIVTAVQVNANFWLVTYAEPAGGAILQAADVITLTLGVPSV